MSGGLFGFGFGFGGADLDGGVDEDLVENDGWEAVASKAEAQACMERRISKDRGLKRVDLAQNLVLRGKPVAGWGVIVREGE